LARYVLPEDVAGFLELPGPSGDSLVDRLGVVYAAIAAKAISYAHEPPSEHSDTQVIRSPAEVLWTPKHATCLDLAITLAAASLKAGLNPVILLIEGPAGTYGRHALVGIWVGAPPEEVVDEVEQGTGWWLTQPSWLAGQVRRAASETGRSLVVLDPVGVSVALPSSPAHGTHASFEEAVAAGAARLLARGTSWQAGVDLAQAWRGSETYQPAARPSGEPLRRPYLDRADARGPLELLRADYGVVPFQPRDELTLLRDLCTQAAANRRTGLAVIHGTGGSGKTRLALELAQRLREQGWYAGLLLHSVAGGSWPASVEWLATVASPLLVVVDYADARVEETKTLLRTVSHRSWATVVVLTARAVEGEWLTDIESFLQRDGHVLTWRQLGLPPVHPDAAVIARRATDTFAAVAEPDRVPLHAESIAGHEPMTTLDYVLLAWLAAHGGSGAPDSRQGLYDAVLGHEQRYWIDVYRSLTGKSVSPLVLRRAAACLSLITTTPETAGEALRAVTDLAHADEWREDIRRTFAECFRAGPGQILALRPHPLADYLVIKVLGERPDLLDRCLVGLDSVHVSLALANLNQARSFAPDSVTTLMADWLRRHPDQWKAVLIVAMAEASCPLAALETLAAEEETVLPLADIGASIAPDDVLLCHLGLTCDTRSLRSLHTTPGADPAELAAVLHRLSGRQGIAGDREAALASVTEAISIWRTLVQANPIDYHLSYLAASLANLSIWQEMAGEHDAALASITEALRYYRALASPSVSDLGDLADALSNLSNHQARMGDDAAALASLGEALQRYRALAEADPDAFSSRLARSLGTFAVRQGDAGNQDAATGAVTEAVSVCRTLGAAHWPDLVGSLNRLAHVHSRAGDHDAAVAAVAEAVSICYANAELSPAAYLPSLADSLQEVSRSQGAAGNRSAALAAATEAVSVFRTLVEANPAAYLPSLTEALYNRAVWQGEARDREGALASITEAVQHQRVLAEAHPAAYLPDLAGSLLNLAVQQNKAGQTDAALVSGAEAVQLYQTLAATRPSAFLPRLAVALSNLSGVQAETGNREAALAAATEAVRYHRALVETRPAEGLPYLAAALFNVARTQVEGGEFDAALASVTEAASLYRTLAQANPAVHLPHLAAALDTLANLLGQSGSAGAALTFMTETVSIRRSLAQADAAAYLPDLAASLNNLSIWQSETGGQAAALDSIIEALGYHRALAEEYPRVFLRDLAISLHTLSSQLGQAGDEEGALDCITEAVGIWRTLAKANAAVHLPDLAKSLNNLAIWQAATGAREEALESITEALEHYRALARADPAAYLAQLALSLDNFARRQAEAGDHGSALASITEAVQCHRTLAEANPAAHLSGLASSLNTLALHQGDAGDQDAAFAAITEALQYAQRLAAADPAAHLSMLVMALRNLTRLSKSILGTDDNPWTVAIASFGNSLLRAQVRAGYAEVLAVSDRRATAIDELIVAADEAQSGDALTLGRARRAIRRVAMALETHRSELPEWATRIIPDNEAEAIEQWFWEYSRLVSDAFEYSWPVIDSFLAEHADTVLQENFSVSLCLYGDLFPENSSIEPLENLLASIDSRGLDVILAANRAVYADIEIITAWMATPTWDESARFFREHRAELTTTRIRELLEYNSHHEKRRQHLAILWLLDDLPLESAYQIVADPSAATERALDLVESGDSELLRIILMAAPEIATDGTTGAFLHAVVALLDDDLDTARQLAQWIAEHGSPYQCEALAIRLRAFARHQADPGPTVAIADVIASTL